MKKNPILIRNILSGRKKPDKIVIGLIGTHFGVGVTHTGIMLSNYLSAYKGLKTAYLEMNTEDELKFLQYAGQEYDQEQEEERQFKIQNTTYYPNVKYQELTNLFNYNYEYFILDFGIDYNKNKNEFMRCDVKLVIGSLTEWKRHHLFDFIESKKQLPGFTYWKYLIIFGQVKDLRIASRELHIKLEQMGYEPDPFLLSKESIHLFQKLIFPS